MPNRVSLNSLKKMPGSRREYAKTNLHNSLESPKSYTWRFKREAILKNSAHLRRFVRNTHTGAPKNQSTLVIMYKESTYELSLCWVTQPRTSRSNTHSESSPLAPAYCYVITVVVI